MKLNELNYSLSLKNDEIFSTSNFVFTIHTCLVRSYMRKYHCSAPNQFI